MVFVWPVPEVIATGPLQKDKKKRTQPTSRNESRNDIPMHAMAAQSQWHEQACPSHINAKVKGLQEDRTHEHRDPSDRLTRGTSLIEPTCSARTHGIETNSGEVGIEQRFTNPLKTAENRRRNHHATLFFTTIPRQQSETQMQQRYRLRELEKGSGCCQDL